MRSIDGSASDAPAPCVPHGEFRHPRVSCDRCRLQPSAPASRRLANQGGVAALRARRAHRVSGARRDRKARYNEEEGPAHGSGSPGPHLVSWKSHLQQRIATTSPDAATPAAGGSADLEMPAGLVRCSLRTRWPIESHSEPRGGHLLARTQPHRLARRIRRFAPGKPNRRIHLPGSGRRSAPRLRGGSARPRRGRDAASRSRLRRSPIRRSLHPVLASHRATLAPLHRTRSKPAASVERSPAHVLAPRRCPDARARVSERPNRPASASDTRCRCRERPPASVSWRAGARSDRPSRVRRCSTERNELYQDRRTRDGFRGTRPFRHQSLAPPSDSRTPRPEGRLDASSKQAIAPEPPRRRRAHGLPRTTSARPTLPGRRYSREPPSRRPAHDPHETPSRGRAGSPCQALRSRVHHSQL